MKQDDEKKQSLPAAGQGSLCMQRADAVYPLLPGLQQNGG